MLGADARRAVDLGEAIDVRDVEAHLRHAFDHRGGRRGRGDERAHLVLDAALQLVRRVDQRLVHDRRAAIVRDAVLLDEPEDRRCLDPAQADVRPRVRRHRPGKAPAVAVEHRQRPEIHRMVRHAPDEDVAHTIKVSAAVVIHHALRVAGGTGGVVERDRFPFVGRPAPCELRVALGEQLFISELAQTLAARELGVQCIDDGDLFLQQLERRCDGRRKFRIGNEKPRLTVLEHEGNRLGVEPRIQGGQHGARHGDTEMALVHRRRVGQHRGHRMADANAALRERGGKPPAARIGLGPGVALGAVDDRRALGINVCGALEERKRRQRRVVGRVLFQIVIKDRRGHGPSIAVRRWTIHTARRRIRTCEKRSS